MKNLQVVGAFDFQIEEAQAKDVFAMKNML
jgi:hypothetical protein